MGNGDHRLHTSLTGGGISAAPPTLTSSEIQNMATARHIHLAHTLLLYQLLINLNLKKYL